MAGFIEGYGIFFSALPVFFTRLLYLIYIGIVCFSMLISYFFVDNFFY